MYWYPPYFQIQRKHIGRVVENEFTHTQPPLIDEFTHTQPPLIDEVSLCPLSYFQIKKM
jgi:hypothetical protein